MQDSSLAPAIANAYRLPAMRSGRQHVREYRTTPAHHGSSAAGAVASVMPSPPSYSSMRSAKESPGQNHPRTPSTPGRYRQGSLGGRGFPDVPSPGHRTLWDCGGDGQESKSRPQNITDTERFGRASHGDLVCLRPTDCPRAALPRPAIPPRQNETDTEEAVSCAGPRSRCQRADDDGSAAEPHGTSGAGAAVNLA
jgi:hypothetical protein